MVHKCGHEDRALEHILVGLALRPPQQAVLEEKIRSDQMNFNSLRPIAAYMRQ